MIDGLEINFQPIFVLPIISHFIVIKEKILLNYNEDTYIVEQEERTRFLFNIINQMEIPVNEFWNGELKLSVKQRMYLREMLLSYNITVVEALDGHMQIYVNQDLTAEWFPSSFVLKKDLRQLDPKKRLYFEMEVKYWSVFEEDNQ